MGLYDQAQKLEAYLEALQSANSIILQAQNIQQPGQIDVTALKTSLRNQVLAGSADKAAFFGTLTTQPTVTQASLESMGFKAVHAAAIIAERDRLRSEALALV